MRLFVYGTLRRGAPMHGLIEGRVRWIAHARAPGRLLDLGGFPGLVEPQRPGDRVVGELYALEPADRDGLLDALDRYEGASFRRERARVRAPEGEIEAWLYRYRGEVRGRPVIAGGDYLSAAGRGAPRG